MHLGKFDYDSKQCKLSNGQPLDRALRKEYRTLTDEERRRFHAAVLKLKSDAK